ncbi:hypothetical protein BG004_005741 [Podila humilis]|nr:hypothetical protein BG004_005741 [Podila humilis]
MPYRTKTSRPSVSSQDNNTSSTISSNPDDIEAFFPELRPLPRAHAPLATNNPAHAIPFDMSILTISHKHDMSSVKAIIVGGGISGLAIAIMMELGGLEYEILERTTGNEPEIGSAISLGPPVLRLFEQIGLLSQIEKASRVVSGLTLVDGECRRIGRIESVDSERYGYPYRVLAHKALYNILLNKVNKTHLHQGKLVVETLQNPNGVTCKCSDGSTYYGDVIIGADGANSLTRERMYMQLKEAGKLPETDMDYSVYDHTVISGVSEPLDSNLYPAIKSEECEFQVIYTKDFPCTLWYMPLAGSRVAWFISKSSASKIKYHPYSHSQGSNTGSSPMSSEFSSSMASVTLRTAAISGSASGINTMSLSSAGNSSNPHHSASTAAASSVASSASSTVSSSGPGSARTPSLSRSSSHQSRINHDWMISTSVDFEVQFKELLDKRCAMGVGSVRDFLQHTPKRAISTVDLEERLYKTWYHGRIVLVGDACHQHLVVGGQGAIQGLLDGVCLVNLLYDMEHSTPHEITKAFKKYQAKRNPVTKTTIEETAMLDKMLHGQGLKAGMMRRFMFSAWTFNLKNDKANNNRPQLSFLPFVEDRGHSKAARQKISGRLTRNRTFSF